MGLKDRNTNSKLSDDKPFSRWLLFTIGGFFTLAYLEFNVIQFFRAQITELELVYQSSNFLILFLIIPFVAFVMVPLIDKLNQIANNRAMFIRISRNLVHVKRLDCDIFHECSAEFSNQTEIIADADKLAKAVSEALRECTKVNKFAIAPFVVFTATVQLSEVQRRAAEQAISEAGALSVKFIPECSSDTEALEFVRQNPYSSNFA